MVKNQVKAWGSCQVKCFNFTPAANKNKVKFHSYGEISSAFDSIKQGLDEALESSKGKKNKAVVHKFSPVYVKNIRAKIGMSQNEFASAFGISVSTLRH